MSATDICVGEAGHCGPDVRSDVQVHLEPRHRGGIEVELQSRVEPYYGESIKCQAEEVLEALNVRHAKLEIHDEGALPFVISARIEAAVRRAGLGEGTRVLPPRIDLPPPSARDRPANILCWQPRSNAANPPRHSSTPHPFPAPENHFSP